MMPGPYSSFFLKAVKHRSLFFKSTFSNFIKDKSLLAKAILEYDILIPLKNKLLFSPTLIALS